MTQDTCGTLLFHEKWFYTLQKMSRMLTIPPWHVQRTFSKNTFLNPRPFFLAPKLWRKNRVFDSVATYMTIIQIKKWDFENVPYSNFWNTSRVSKVWPITWSWRLVVVIFLGKNNFLITLEGHTCSPWRTHIFIQISLNSNPVFLKYLNKMDQSVHIHPSDPLVTLGEDFSITWQHFGII